MHSGFKVGQVYRDNELDLHKDTYVITKVYIDAVEVRWFHVPEKTHKYPNVFCEFDEYIRDLSSLEKELL